MNTLDQRAEDKIGYYLWVQKGRYWSTKYRVKNPTRDNQKRKKRNKIGKKKERKKKKRNQSNARHTADNRFGGWRISGEHSAYGEYLRHTRQKVDICHSPDDWLLIATFFPLFFFFLFFLILFFLSFLFFLFSFLSFFLVGWIFTSGRVYRGFMIMVHKVVGVLLFWYKLQKRLTQ